MQTIENWKALNSLYSNVSSAKFVCLMVEHEEVKEILYNPFHACQEIHCYCTYAYIIMTHKK